MKQLIKTYGFKSFFCLMMVNLVSLIVLAQDSTGGSSSSTTTTTTRTATSETTWYTNPWIWVVGAAVFILLLIALLRGSGNRGTTGAGRTDRVTVTKTTRSDVE